MFAAIRSRISRAYAALFAMTVIALSVFVPQTAHAGYASYSRPSMSYSRSYYSAPRVYVAPRVAVFVRPRPVIIAPIVRPYYRPPVVIGPMISPTQVVQADGGAPMPVQTVSTGPDWGVVFLVMLVFVVVISLLAGGFYYGGSIFVSDPFAIDEMIALECLEIDMAACDGGLL
jgi:hypothetical protein